MQGDIYQEVVKIRAEGQEAALVTVISASGSTPREEGAKMLVRPDGSIVGSIGGGSVELQIIKEAIEVIKRGKPVHLCYRLKEGEELGMLCGGDVEIFIEPVIPAPTVFIFGGGHIALALAKMAKLVGFKIVVIDNRPEYAAPQRFPEAEQTLAIDYAQAFPKLKIGRTGYIIIVTHGHMGDEVVLEGALKTEAKYIGMIGSKTKNKVVYSHLLAKGVTKEQLDKIYAPIGLSIHAQTPEEIAVSILAEIIKVRKSD
jgi:xanthine dehydrogenase accessory factor